MSAYELFWNFWVIDNWGEIELDRKEWLHIVGTLYWKRIKDYSCINY